MDNDNNTIRIALCDDDAEARSQTAAMAANYIDSHPQLSLSLHSFPSSQELLDAITAGQSYEIYLLDIIMPGLDGIQLGKRIRNIDQRAAVIYLTSSPDYAVQSYSVQAFYYLLKPVDPENLAHILECAVNRHREEWGASLLIKTRDGLVRTPLASLVYVEYQNHRLAYHMADGSVFYGPYRSVSFDAAAAEILKDNRFIKTSTSFLVNMSYVYVLTSKSFLINGKTRTEIPISRAFYQMVKNQYMHYVLDKGGAMNG